jgi:large subunit ribosomal protein L29
MIDVETLKGQSVGELIKLAKKLQDELFQAKFQHATQQLKTPHKLRDLRRDIARVKTFATMKRNEGKGAVKAAPAKKAAAPKVAPAPKTEKAEKPAKKAASKKKEK